MSKTIQKTLAEFSKYAAEQFLQTAVFIDDRIYDQKAGTVTSPKILKKPEPLRKRALKSATSNTSTSKKTTTKIEESVEYSPHDILTSFAKKHIVCSLYQPKKNASVGPSSDAYQLCVASDIVIVDWDLYGDRGEKAKELISNLIYQSLTDVPEQLRLVLVYTQEANLTMIANEVYESLSKVMPGSVEPVKEDRGLALHTPNSRVVIIGKTGRRLAQYDSYVVNEKDLADRTISEFLKLASGLLQSTMLLGMAKIRGNSRKILSRFDSSLDPAFLTHRALSLPHEDATDHILPLLVAEIQAILDDCLPSPVISDDVISDWCNKRWEPAPHCNEFVRDEIDSGINVVDFAKAFCLTGPAIKGTYPSIKLNITSNKDGTWSFRNGKKFDKLATFLQTGTDSCANQKLAMLMSHRPHYNADRRDLSLGTIVRLSSRKGKEYFICLQPVCDSVRLSTTRRFVFCSLKLRDVSNGSGKMNQIVSDEDKVVELNFQPKSFNSTIIEFSPDANTEKVMAKENNGSFLFTSIDGKNFVWVAQLKAEHAQRAVEQFARELSRVGLTESEWLRLMSK